MGRDSQESRGAWQGRGSVGSTRSARTWNLSAPLRSLRGENRTQKKPLHVRAPRPPARAEAGRRTIKTFPYLAHGC